MDLSGGRSAEALPHRPMEHRRGYHPAGAVAGGQHEYHNMKKPRENPVRENRIADEVVVDAYGPEERAMGWYCYLQDKIRFPFLAQCISSKAVSPLRTGEEVEVCRMAPEDVCSNDML